MGDFLAVSNDRKTIHIWSMGSCIKKSKEINIQNNNINNNITVGKNEDKKIENEIEEELPENPSGFFLKMKEVLPKLD